MALPKKRTLRTIRVPPGLPDKSKSSAVTKPKEARVRPVKTVQGEVVRDALPKPKEQPKLTQQKALPSPRKEAVKSVAKKVGGTLLKRAGILGAAVSAGMAIKDMVTSKKDTPSEKRTPNVESTGKKTEIKIEKKPTRPTKKPSVPESAKPKGKSETRVAFEKEFAKQRRAGAKEFTFRGKRYNTRLKGEK